MIEKDLSNPKAFEYRRKRINQLHENLQLGALKDLARELFGLGLYSQVGIVFDTVIEDMPADAFHNRPWGPANNPKTAVWEWLSGNPGFEVDKDIENKLLFTVAPDGYLRRVAV